LRYLARRIGFYLFTLWAAITLNFAIPRLMPGNPVQAVFSFSYFPSTTLQVIMTSLPWTAALIGVATVISFLVGTALGIMSGWWRGSWMDSLLPITTFLGSIPYFWFGLLAAFFLADQLHWFPLSGATGTTTPIGVNWSFVTSASYHAILPAATIVIASIGGWMLGMRNMMVTTQAEDYVLLAEAKGLSPRRIMITYAARNAILPTLATFAMSLGFVVSGAILVEIVFSYPGLGYVLFQAVTNNDYPLMQGVFLMITVAVLAANFLADLAYVALDPRTRLSHG
jgi:peptide/nickel transport system permease protein